MELVLWLIVRLDVLFIYFPRDFVLEGPTYILYKDADYLWMGSHAQSYAFVLNTCPFFLERVMLLSTIIWQGFLPEELQIFGYARSKLTNEELHEKLRG